MLMEQIVRGNASSIPKTSVSPPKNALPRNPGDQTQTQMPKTESEPQENRCRPQRHIEITPIYVQDGISNRQWFHMRGFRHKHFADLLNVVCLLKTHLQTREKSHVLLFSSDLDMDAETIIDYYSLRFQIEFNILIPITS